MDWLYDKVFIQESTPSRKAGIDYETEIRYRVEGAKFIMGIGTRLKLHVATMATGIVYFHRFYMIHTFSQFPRWLTAVACLFLAGKVEENPKKCKDLLKAARTLIPEIFPETAIEQARESVMAYERILLQTIKFDLMVDHPYKYLLQYGKKCKGQCCLGYAAIFDPIVAPQLGCVAPGLFFRCTQRPKLNRSRLPISYGIPDNAVF